MKRLLSEPLLHFLLAGAALFALYGTVNPLSGADPERIVVAAGTVEHLATTFARVWQRPPTAQELKGLIDDYVKEEVLSREAIRLGLDQNDTVIRRRLRQKMEFLAEDFAAALEPTEAELEEFLRANPERFREEPRYTFRQVFLSPERGDGLDADAAVLLVELRTNGAAADVSALGDRLSIPTEVVDEPRRAVASQFGQAFADRLDGIAVGAWSGPVRSGYGVHLVLVTSRTEGREPPLAEIRELVRRELLTARREQANRDLLARLLANYEVVVEWPQEDAGATTAAGGL